MPRDEDLLTEAIEILNNLALHTVSQDWIESVWDAQFTECEELPADYEESISHLNLPNQFSRLADICKKWIRLHKEGEVTRLEATTSNSNGEDHNISGTVNFYRKSFWDALIDQDIKYKVLIGLLYLFMDRGQAQISDQDARDLGIKSASLYFILLGIPGSGAFNIFHSILYSKALDTFKLIATLNLAKKSPKKKAGRGRGASQASQSRGRGRGSQARASQRSRHGSGGSQGSEEGSDDDTGPELTQREVHKLFGQLNSVLDSLLILLDNCSLKRSSESLELTVSCLVDLTLLETQFSELDFDGNRSYGELSGLAVNGYIALQKLSGQLHGARTVLHVFKGLMPSILTVPRGASDMTGRALSNIRELALKFIKHLVRHDTEDVVQPALVVLVEHLAVKVPDKTDYRKLAADAIVALMEEMTADLYRKAVKWFVIFCHTDKATHRLFSLEVLGRLISSTPPQGGTPEASTIAHPGTSTPAAGVTPGMESDASGPGTSTPADPPPPGSQAAVVFSPKFLFATIYGRCADVSASTRAHALKTLGEITADGGSVTSDIVKELLSDEREGVREKRPISELLQDQEVDLEKIDPLPSSKDFIDFLRRRALDQSVFVRKSALQVLENVLKLSGSLMSGDLIKVLAEHCRDSSLAVRKQMVISLTELLKMYPDNDELLNIWVEGVFPLILDVEAKAAETVLERIWEVLFQNMVSVNKVRTAEQNLPWAILDSVEKQKMTNYLSRACNTWAKEGKLTVKILGILQSYIGSPHNASAWMLLATVTQHVPCKEPRFVLDYFNQSIHSPETVGLFTLQQVLKVLFSSVARLGDEDRMDLQANLLQLVRKFKIPPDLIQVAVDVITVVSSLEAGENLKHYQSSVDGWAVPIIEEIDSNLSEFILKEGNENSNPNQTISDGSENKMMRQIFTLGELAQICPLRINRRLFLLMQSIIFQKGEKNNKPQVSQEEVDIPTSQTQSSQVTCVFVPSKKLQALTIVTLGKMCLQHEEQAKKIIPAFGAILTTSSDSSIKNNAMYMLTDMCVRFASLVDPLLPAMTSCLKDKSISVRRTTLILLIHLLQEDFLKIRGNSHFFLRILMTLQDPSEEIRGLTIFYIQQRLLKRLPNIMYSLFTETLFHLNEYRHSNEKVVLTDKEKKMFSLVGEENKDARRNLYKFMLENMSDTHRFTTTHRLCQDILNGVVEKTIRLEGAGNDLLKDTLYILASDEIKLASLKSRGGGEDEEGGDNLEAALVAATKRQIITQVVKKNTIENILPIVIALKTKLTEDKSPLVGDVFNFLRKLMEDYKDEVTEILDANKQLASEIAYDIRMYEEGQEKEREEEEKRKEMEEREKARRAAAPQEVPEVPGSPGLASVQKALLETARRGKGQAGLMAETVLKNLLRNAKTVAETPGEASAAEESVEDARNIGDTTSSRRRTGFLQEEEEEDARNVGDSRRRTIGGIGVRQRKGSSGVVQEEGKSRRKSGGDTEMDKVKNRVRELLNNSKRKSPEKERSRIENSTNEAENSEDVTNSSVAKNTIGSDLDKDTPRRSRSKELSPEKEKGGSRKEKEVGKGTGFGDVLADLDNDAQKKSRKSKKLSSEKEKGETRIEKVRKGAEKAIEESSEDDSASTASDATQTSDLDKDTQKRSRRSKKLSPEKEKGETRIEKELEKSVEERMEEDTEDDSASTASNVTKTTFNSDLDKDTPKTKLNSDLDTPESLKVQTDKSDLNKSNSKNKTATSMEVQPEEEASQELSDDPSTDNTAASLEAQTGGEPTKDLSSNSEITKDTSTDQSGDGKEPSENTAVHNEEEAEPMELIDEAAEQEKEEERRKLEQAKKEKEEERRKLEQAEKEKEEKRQKQEKAEKEKEQKRKNHKKEEEKMRIQTEIAKIRVKVSMKKDDLDEAVKNQDFTEAQLIKKQLDKLDSDATALKLQLAAVEEPSPSKDADTSRRISGQGVKGSTKDVETSRRISGHTRIENKDDGEDSGAEEEGDPQTVQSKTPATSKARRLHALRAISTPHVDQTILGRPNVTFMEESAHDISAISNLSPQSTLSLASGLGRRSNERPPPADDTDAISFRFRPRGREMFDDLFEGVEKRNSGKGGANRNSEGAEEGGKGEKDPSSSSSKKRKTKTPRTSLERIAECSQESNETNAEEEPKEKRKRKASK